MEPLSSFIHFILNGTIPYVPCIPIVFHSNNNNEIPQDYYSRKIKTELNNEMNLDIRIIHSELSITCFFVKNYIKKTFSNSFPLDILKNQSNIFRAFTTVEQILNEIINKKTKEKDYIAGNEECILYLMKKLKQLIKD